MNIIDMHCDTISAIRHIRKSASCTLRINSLQIDLEKMKQGGYLLQNFALFVNLSEEENPMEAALSMVDLYYEELEKNQDMIRPVFSYEDIIRNQADGVMSALLTLEEGEICKGSLENLRNFYRLGARMMTLTWNYENQLGFPNHFPKRSDYTEDFKPRFAEAYPIFGKPNQKGLKEKGLEFLTEMEKLGMIIDVSHLSDGGFYDVYEHTSRPFVASHSNARSLCGNCRNLTDDMIRKMGERGCVIGLNYFGNFLSFHPEGHDSKSTMKDIARHARYIADIGGISCLGLGSDYDGFSGDIELSDCSMLPLLEQEFKKQNFSSSDIDKILYQNVLNLYRDIL